MQAGEATLSPAGRVRVIRWPIRQKAIPALGIEPILNLTMMDKLMDWLQHYHILSFYIKCYAV